MSELPFPPIRLKKPRNASPSFPSEIRSVQAAIRFINSHVGSETRKDNLHWGAAISALNAVATGGSYAHARAAMLEALTSEGWVADTGL
jgi:hypothetical protein